MNHFFMSALLTPDNDDLLMNTSSAVDHTDGDRGYRESNGS